VVSVRWRAGDPGDRQLSPLAGRRHFAAVDERALRTRTRKSISLVTLGYGDAGKLFSRNPRPDFEEIASFA
jgi:hypothetical protein